ncbi:MAG TPA: PepSY domain-containing protein [Mariprofundaceae bacterium]|nr:PepSY domain-containing protein [Mariprofundaceae bacterium]
MKRFLHRATIIRAHRSIALFSILLIMFTAITGFLLQHAKDFGWHQQSIEQDWILDIYDVKPAMFTSFSVVNQSQQYVTQVEHLWFHNTAQLPIQGGHLVGAANMGSLLVLANQHQLHLFTQDLDLVESMDVSLDGAIRGMGVQRGVLILQTDTSWYQADESLLVFTQLAAANTARLSKITTLPKMYAQVLPERVTDLHYMRFMQDLHGGRLFGLPHWMIPDLTAFALLFLSLTGLMMKWKRSRVLGQL